jgi:aminoglycoside phosphotransferase (APT) family kinase protein
VDVSRDIEVSQFPGGHSNLTYLLRFGPEGTTELVMRRPPLGPVAPRAHDMAREYHWLEAMHPVFPLAPKPYLLCEDPTVLGSVFYLMERRRGVVVRHEEPPELEDHPDLRRRVSEALVDTLARLHAVDVSHPPLSALGKPSGFVERQVRGWTERWQRSRIADVPDMEWLAAWLIARLPPEPSRPTVVHGDFKLDNVLLDPADLTKLVAVFDWEMSALGDPLVDVGILLAYWAPTSPPAQRDALTTVTDRPGYLTRDAIVAHYADRSGRDVSRIGFYETFALFKVAVVVQQIFYRYKRGQTDDRRFASFGERVSYLARQARELTQRA